MKNRKNNKGFTLAELLIVVAIIGVLTAIAIPVFTAQLEKSREATDLANLRSAYAEMTADLLTWDGVTSLSAKTVAPKQTQTGWQTGENIKVGELPVGAITSGSWTIKPNASNDGVVIDPST